MSARTVQTDLSAYVNVKTTDKTPNILDLIVRLVTEEEGPWRGTVRELRDCLGLDIPSQSLAVLLEQAQAEFERRGIVIDRKHETGQHVIAISYEPEAGAAPDEPSTSHEPGAVSHAEIATAVEYPVTFPFSWVINAKEITRIRELSHEEQANARQERKTCSLCGSKEIAYEKLSSGFSHLICAECATRYVLNADALKRRVES
ncbi:MAG: hypothetical protein JW878_06285 [Methanomicrobia archaeon]|nr:hypothetical protein [Methanomicrobia archaeon]